MIAEGLRKDDVDEGLSAYEMVQTEFKFLLLSPLRGKADIGIKIPISDRFMSEILQNCLQR